MRFDKLAHLGHASRSASAVFLVSLLTDDYLRREGLDGPEIYALYLLAAIGGIVMGAANDLIVLFLGLEILSIALYVLAASHRKRIAEPGERHQVLRARRLLLGVLPLRRRAHLRRHRQHQLRRRSSARSTGTVPVNTATTR